MDCTWVLPQINLLFLFKIYLFIIACNTNKYPVMYPGFHARLHLPVKSKLHEWMRQEFEKSLHKFGLSCWTHSFVPSKAEEWVRKTPEVLKMFVWKKKKTLPSYTPFLHPGSLSRCKLHLCSLFPHWHEMLPKPSDQSPRQGTGQWRSVRSKNYLLAVDTKQIACMRWSMVCDFKYCKTTNIQNHGNGWKQIAETCCLWLNYTKAMSRDCTSTQT